MNTSNYCIIGDVHGYYGKLMRLIKKLPADAGLVFVGDLIDRGPDSSRVIDFVRSNGHRCVLGNHELLMIAQKPLPGIPWQKDDAYCLWMENGGAATLKSYGLGKYEMLRREGDSPLLAPFFRDVAWLETLPYYIELEGCRVNGRTVLVSHSSISKIWRKRETDPAAFNRDVVINRDLPEDVEGVYNVFGHSPFRSVKCYDYAARIDTGPYLYGKLSALELPSLKVYDSL